MGTSAPSSLEMRLSNDEALDITPFVKRFVWTESMIHGGFSWSIKFLANKWKEWDFLMMGRDSPDVQFRLRSEEDSGPQSTEWRTAIVDKSRAAFSQDRSMVGEVKGADRRLLLAQTPRTRAFSDLLASQVLSQIASEHALTPDIEATSSIESWVQSRTNDWAFMRRLARASSTQGGRCDTYLWMDEQTLRFAAPQLADESDRQYDMSTVEGRVDSYAVTYHGRQADRMGAASLRGVGFDFNTKQGITFEMGPGTASTQPSLAGRVPRRMADGLRIIPVFDADPASVESVVRSRWGRAAPRYLGMRINSRPDLTLQVNKVISMESNLDEDAETPFMGRYAVLEVQHVMERGSIATSLTAYRREAQIGEAQPTGASADIPGTRDRFQDAGIMPRTIVTAQEI